MISISPNTPQTVAVGSSVCFQAEAVIIIPQEDERYIDLPASGPDYSYSAGSGTWVHTASSISTGGNSAYNIYGKQPFYIHATNWVFNVPAAPNRIHASYVGVFDNTLNCSGAACFHGWLISKNCGSIGVGTCAGPNGDNANNNWKAQVLVAGGVVATFAVNFKESFRLRSDGINLNWDIYTSGAIGPYPGTSSPRWVNSLYVIPLPVSDSFRFHVNAHYLGNQWDFIRTFKGTYQGSVPLTWTTPMGGTLTGTGNNRCFSSGISGTYSVCVDSDFDDPVCIDVEVAPLYLKPIGLDCGECVYTNQIVKFESNGGLNGTLTAESDPGGSPAGLIIDALTWQAPGSPGDYILTYTLGMESVDCAISVVEPLTITNVEGGILTGLVPGDTFQLESNYDAPDEIIWENIDCPNLVSPSGLITIPFDSNSDCFNAIDCRVRARLVAVEGFTCTNLIDLSNPVVAELRVLVNPVFPSANMGGPRHTKWLRQVPEFKGFVTEFDGGCDETHLRNYTPIYRWNINYDGLKYEIDDPCEPDCCDDPAGFVNGFLPRGQTAKRLDDFWMQVTGPYGYFTLIDYETGEVWENARFEEAMTRDHRHRIRSQNRSVQLVWRPCCAVSPKGGTCQHKTIRTDTYPPTVPASLAAEAKNAYVIWVTWDASMDNIGVKGYVIEVDGVEINLGNKLIYKHLGVLPGSNHIYRVRAYDFAANYSDWTSTVNVTTPTIDVQPPAAPGGLSSVADGFHKIGITYSDSTDNVGVDHYDLLVDGSIINNGTALSYDHLGLSCGSTHYYYVRAVDAIGNKSVWSGPVNATTDPDSIAPTVDIIEPTAGSTVFGTITIGVNATDNIGIDRVEYFYYNGTAFVYLNTSSTGPHYEVTFDTTTIPDGQGLFGAASFDACGNKSVDDIIGVTIVNNDLEAPTIQIDSPIAVGSIPAPGYYSGNLPLRATASDNVSVSRVEWYWYNPTAAEFQLISVNYNAPTYEHVFNTLLVPNGNNIFGAIAFDEDGNLGYAFVTTDIENNVAVKLQFGGNPLTMGGDYLTFTE